MRRIAGIGIVMLALAGCQSLPSVIRIEVDGTTIAFEKKEPPAPGVAGNEVNAIEADAVESNAVADAPTP
jgi:hypothetical protein